MSQLLNGQLAELLTISDSFLTGLVNTTSAYKGGRWEWQIKNAGKKALMNGGVAI